ncbi:putative F-box domain, leucine-rich repeat domain, L domain-containing protein [Lupinus albus]|uniref:Putative F-box domain, leucine-rich repeat domain, L domain-containing protein n=1 Tax=Lupinus albus TaxID=3870 RepID=A0A6A4PN30_LUPAL|nr:putative F-box domain, leucine-rich repeat domain, L domain-containing protein [Lupinus albus]
MRKRRHSEIKGKDLLSDLPDSILLHVLNFMRTKNAVQTCVLSLRWEHLWKRLTNLKFDSSHFPTSTHFTEFVSSILIHRDNSISLQNVSLRHPDYFSPEILYSFIEYLVSHGIQHLTLDTKFSELPPCIFSCRSLTFLKISNLSTLLRKTVLPKSLGFPALKTLHLDNVSFITNDNDYAEPFSTCNMLTTLVIANSFEKGLCVNNSTLTSLTINTSHQYDHEEAHSYKIVLSTPRLTSLDTNGYLVYQLSSTCNLLYLEDVNFDVTCSFRNFPSKSLVLITWLHVFTNVTTMTISSKTLEILNVLLFHPSKRTNLPCFNRLKSIKVELGSLSRISSDMEVRRIIEYLLQNSPPTSVNIIRDA